MRILYKLVDSGRSPYYDVRGRRQSGALVLEVVAPN